METNYTEKPSEASMSATNDMHGAPALPPRMAATSNTLQPGDQSLYARPPSRASSVVSTADDISSPVHYTRDPHKLVAYIVPFPKPKLHGISPESVPTRFLIYTPPPPPLKAPAEGDKEAKIHKVQRKWQEEVRSAKTSTAKTASWHGVKSKATRGIDKAMGWTKTSNLEFINRINIGGDKDSHDQHNNDGVQEKEETHRTVGLEEMVLIYPASLQSTPEQLKVDFVESMMRSKSKAQKDAILATGLLPVAFAVDVLATLVWPFGGLAEVDGVWAAANIRGAKISRNVTKRLTSSSKTGNHEQDTLKLSFTPSPRLETLDRYLAARCHDCNAKAFPAFGAAPTETEILQSIGWEPSQTGGETKNWEDEQWETTEVKDDMKAVMTKAAREWDKWCQAYEKNPEKGMKK